MSEFDSSDSSKICDQASHGRVEFINNMNYLINRNETILGVYVTGSSFGNSSDTGKLNRFRRYLDNLEDKVWVTLPRHWHE
tara:strand:- start:211 stop:453 length:243 start_codon:yes stop_codon:yes gene_type:complete